MNKIMITHPCYIVGDFSLYIYQKLNIHQNEV